MMNNSQKLGIFFLIFITVVYVYFSFFHQGDLNAIHRAESENSSYISDDELSQKDNNPTEKQGIEYKNIKIFVTDANGNMRSVNRKCDVNKEKSCFALSIKELIAGPTQWEKTKKGLSSEIPIATKILSIREGDNNILIDLSSTFESGGGAESTEIRVRQLIKTAQANTKLPVYLYINGKQADVIGGEGIMIKQPLTENSLDD